ncbi:MAG: hypothetical protein M3505_09000 [Verrucomicrobiota bacterium]|nr:hypothetical protein [Verrucomicrobiota bacterium]
MLRKSFTQRVCLSIAGISLLCGSSAFGQEPPSAPEVVAETEVGDVQSSQPPSVDETGAVAETERVVVTGTYIPMPTAESEGALPVTNYATEQLIKFGSNTPAEGLRQLPSFVGNTETEKTVTAGTVRPRSTCALTGARTR